jgi:hypothetical protein
MIRFGVLPKQIAEVKEFLVFPVSNSPEAPKDTMMSKPK